MIKLKNLNKFYGKTQVLKDINLSIEKGEFVVLLGKSGSGKSTLLNMIGLIDEPSSGEYYFGELNLYALNNEEKSAFRSENLGFIFQRYNLMPLQSVLENVIMPALYAKKNKQSAIARAKELLAQLELSEQIDKSSAHLSGGQQQRVSVARALINDANFILADEPTGALDSANGLRLMQILKSLNERGVGIILVTHDESLCEYASRVIRMSDGVITEDVRVRTHKQSALKSTQIKSEFKDKLIANLSFFAQNIKLALNNLITNKLRSFLTMLGLIIATVSVISTISLGNGAKADILDEIKSLGTNTIIIHKGARYGDRNSGRIRNLNLDDLKLIKRLDFVKEVGVETGLYGSYVTHKKTDVDVLASGVYHNYLQISAKQIAEGRFFTEQENADAANVCVISSNLAKTLFKFENPIDRVIYLNGRPLRIIGVLQKDKSERDGFDIRVYLPHNTVANKFDGKKYLRQIVVLLHDEVNSELADESIRQVLEIKKGPKSIITFNQDAIKKSIESSASKLGLLILGIAFIAMIVGGIGVMNIMLVVVKERTKEIGIKLAIGASPRSISAGFLIESVVLCSVAACIGVAFSYAVVNILNALDMPIKMLISFDAVLLGFLSSALVGLFFGYFPAKQASKLIPAQALLTE